MIDAFVRIFFHLCSIFFVLFFHFLPWSIIIGDTQAPREGKEKKASTLYAQFISLAMYISLNRWVAVPTPPPMPFNRCKEHAPNAEHKKNKKEGNRVYSKHIFFLSYHIYSFFAFISSPSFLRFYRAYISIDTKNKRWKSTCLYILYPAV